jgi:carbamoyl-phosphate synthase large subunit
VNKEEAIRIADRIGYPVVVRPSFVLGGRAMEIVYDRKDLEYYMETAVQVSPGKPVLIDRFLDGAIEIDVDAICDGHDTVIGGIMEHIEEAGIHSGDSACVLPPVSLEPDILETIMEHTRALAGELSVVGLMNIQYAVKAGIIYVIEVNPTGLANRSLCEQGHRCAAGQNGDPGDHGKTLKELGLTREVIPEYVSVKEAVFPFSRFPGVDTILGPEMKSTGEVMGIDRNFGLAFGKSQLAAGQKIPFQEPCL